jgi:hypothetical protein
MALDEEKRRLEQMIKEFHKEHEMMKLEYEETIAAMKMVQQDKEALQSTTQSLMVSTYATAHRCTQATCKLFYCASHGLPSYHSVYFL